MLGSLGARRDALPRRRWPAPAGCIALWVLLFTVASGREGLAAELAADNSRVSQIKAAFIFNFAQFTEWPTEAFADKDAPLVIGILGSNPFGDVLEETVRNEGVRGRRLVVERYNRVAEIKTCHILYIGQSEENRLDNVREALKNKPVLTVTDIENAATRGIIIELMRVQNRIRFRVNVEASKAANLTLSSKLLRAAEIAKR